MPNKVDQLAKILPMSWDSNSAIHYSKLTDAVNSLLGYNGTAVIANDLDVQGNAVQNVADPATPTDALNLQTAEGKYAPSVQSKALDIGGSSPLKTLAYLYKQNLNGFTGTVVTAKLTGGGANGAMIFKNGQVVSVTPAT